MNYILLLQKSNYTEITLSVTQMTTNH